MTTPSKRSKKPARAAGASESSASASSLEAEAVEAEEMHSEETPSEDQEVTPVGLAGPAEEAEEKTVDVPMEGEPTVPVNELEEEPEAMSESTVVLDDSDDSEDEEDEEDEEAELVEPVSARVAPVTKPLPAVAPAIASEEVDHEAEGEATMIARTPSRPRKTTLAMAITPRPMPTVSDSPTPRDSAAAAEAPADPRNAETEARHAGEAAGIADEIDEWSIADQPTVYLSPQLLTRPPQLPRQQVDTPAPDRSVEAPRRPAEHDLPPRERGVTPPRWLASTDEDHWPATTHRPQSTPEALRPFPPSDEHAQRLQRLREGRRAHQEGNRAPGESRQVADIVRQWWRDLRPGLSSALNYQREARASGIHPIPAHEPSPSSRLGDAFGRFAASAREMTGRAQSAMSPRLNRLQELHAQAESRASALVQKMEAPLSRQQAPLLGPGRIAVFFKPGVTLGQAQSLLGASRARPIRLIPRKRGFLALVPPGAEADICERLREHPYIRDVAYVEYDEYGDPIRPSAPPR